MHDTLPRRILLEPGCEEDALTSRILKRARGRIDVETLTEETPPPARGDLVLKRQKGRWIRPFRGGETGPGKEFFLTAIQGCPFGCAYCFTQGYLDGAATVIHTNTVQLFEELEAFLDSPAATGARLHAAHLGELIVWEEWTGLAGRLAELFRRHRGTVLEIRTKSDEVTPSPAAGLPENVVLSWTLSPDEWAAKFEAGTPGPCRRIEAAVCAAGRGARVGFRLDPVILLPGWEEAYTALLADLARAVPGESLESIEIGMFRCTKKTGEAIRLGEFRTLMAGELLPGEDGKIRYFWPLRVRAYRFLIEGIRRFMGPEVSVRLCMEPEWIRERVLESGEW